MRYLTIVAAAMAAPILGAASAGANIVDDTDIGLHIELTGPQPLSYAGNFDPGSLAASLPLPPPFNRTVDFYDAAGLGGTGLFSVGALVEDLGGFTKMTVSIANFSQIVIDNIAGTLAFTGVDWGSTTGTLGAVDAAGLFGDLSTANMTPFRPGALSVIDGGTGVSVDFAGLSLAPNQLLQININVNIRHTPSPVPNALPEPGTLAVFAMGLAGVATLRRRRGV